MGEAIATSSFEPEDYEAFCERLRNEPAILGELLERPGFGSDATSIGAGVEMALVDRDMRSARVNEDVLAALGGEAGPRGIGGTLASSLADPFNRKRSRRRDSNP